MPNTDRARKLFIRATLVTTTTVTTLIGAQNLAMLDTRQIEPMLTPVAEEVLSTSQLATPTLVPTLVIQPTVEINHASPSIVILRRPGESGPIQQTSVTRTAIQPPSPVVLAPPDPVIVQGEAPPPIIIQQASGSSSGSSSSSSSSRTRSSR